MDIINNLVANSIVAVVVSSGTSLELSAKAQESIKRRTSAHYSELASGSSRVFIGSTDDGVSGVFESGVEDGAVVIAAYVPRQKIILNESERNAGMQNALQVSFNGVRLDDAFSFFFSTTHVRASREKRVREEEKIKHRGPV